MSESIEEADGEDAQEQASELMLRVALVLLGEARIRGDFGEEEELEKRAAVAVTELGDGASSPNPNRAAVEVAVLGPDSISLSARTGRNSAVHESLRIDGILFDGGSSFGVSFADARTPTPEEMVEIERFRAERKALEDRAQGFTATRYLRTIAAPPRPGAAKPVLAVELFEDGFYVEYSYDSEPMRHDEAGADRRLTARALGGGVEVEDDLGTEYLQSGHGGGGGVRVTHACQGFAPAPPPEARILRVTTGGASVELDLRAPF